MDLVLDAGISCSQPVIAPNSTISGTFLYMDIVTYNCNTGFNPTGGQNMRTCTSAGTWDGSPLLCTSKYGVVLNRTKHVYEADYIFTTILLAFFSC